jgi:putative nucleotidyltransferase with HDIG domain
MVTTLRALPADIRRRAQVIDWRRIGLASLMMLSTAVLLITLLAWQLPFGGRFVVEAGQVAPFTVVAPQALTYASDVLTLRAQERAAQAVPDQFDTDEAGVRRQQVALARTITEQIGKIRADPDATLAQKNDQLTSIADLNLDATTAVQILSLSQEEWDVVVSEAPLVLDRVMRDEIRESTLSTARRRVPVTVSSRLSEPASDVAIALTQALIRPNSIVNVERTEQMRAEARAAVAPVPAVIEQGEVVIRAGDIAGAEEAEALAQLSALGRQWDPYSFLHALVFGSVLLVITLLAIFRLNPKLLRDFRQLSLLMLLAVAWLLAAKMMISSQGALAYLYPLAALGILTAVLCDLRVAIVLMVGVALVVVNFSLGNAALLAYLMLGALAGTLTVGRGERLNSFLWAGVVIAGTNIAVLTAFLAPFDTPGAPGLFEALLLSAVNGILSSAIALIGYFTLGNLFDITTPLQLTELSRPTHPLLRQLLLKAPGTYHHTILVSNMAERAAAAVGADALLVRVGAYYHDIGKTVRPYFFAENIMDSSSPHEKLDPYTSAQIIISHVKDGVDLAQKYHLPERIQDFIREHHGHSLVKYFYVQAQRQSDAPDAINEADFRYPGPNPRSKETSLLLLADTCEAAVRAVRPGSREEMAALVNRLIEERILSGELSDSELTFADLQIVKEVFLQVLQGVHHPRIVYPDVRQPAGQLFDATEEQDQPAPVANGNGRTLHGGVEETTASQTPSMTTAATQG